MQVADKPLLTGVEYAGRRYVREPVPVHFPEGEDVGESKRHLKQRTALYQVLELEFASRAAIGSDQFVYWNPTDPRECLSSDVFIRLGVADDDFKSWKVWERGAPHVAVEVISDNDARDRDWDAKLRRYERMGVDELVRFDHLDAERPLRIWNRLEGDLVERLLQSPRLAECIPLELFWVVVEDEQGCCLRLSRVADGSRWLSTPAEQAAEHQQRIRELEAELGKR